MELEEIRNTLRKCELFSELTEEEIATIAELGSVGEYNSGEIIYNRGDLGTKLYVLSKGQVSLYRQFSLAEGRRAYIPVYVLRETARRRLMGAWCTLVGEQHIQMCSARCDRPSTVISIECSRLREVIVENQNIRVKILEKLALILRDRIESSYAAVESL